MTASERDTLRTAALALACPLNDVQIDQLLGYRDMIARWNKVYNLTAIRDPQQMLIQHLLDSLAAVAPLRRHTGAGPARLLDVGSGGGLPGAVLAIACPELEVICVDAVAKKASFLRQVAGELGLKTLQARHARVEALHEPAFDVITSRAFASLADFTRLTRHLLAPGGRWMAMKGSQAESEFNDLPADVQLLQIEPLTVPGLGAQRCLVWLRRQD